MRRAPPCPARELGARMPTAEGTWKVLGGRRRGQAGAQSWRPWSAGAARDWGGQAEAAPALALCVRNSIRQPALPASFLVIWPMRGLVGSDVQQEGEPGVTPTPPQAASPAPPSCPEPSSEALSPDAPRTCHVAPASAFRYHCLRRLSPDTAGHRSVTMWLLIFLLLLMG